MTIVMPSCPLPNETSVFLRDPGGELVPFLGGPDIRLNRLGMRFGVRFVMPEMDGEEARTYVARLLRGRMDEVLIPWPQTVYVDTDPGSPKVASGVTGGSAIPVADLSASYTIREGQFFSIVHAGRRYIHMATGPLTGPGALGIFPPLRTPLSANDIVEIENPMIQGRVSPGDELSWQQAIDLTTSIPFSVVERK